MNSWPAELATFSQNDGNSVTQTNWIILNILVESKTLESETLHNIEQKVPQWKYRLGTVSNEGGGGGAHARACVYVCVGRCGVGGVGSLS